MKNARKKYENREHIKNCEKNLLLKPKNGFFSLFNIAIKNTQPQVRLQFKNFLIYLNFFCCF